MPNDLQQQINQLKQQLESLQGDYFKGNFSSSQDINKYTRFNSRLRVPRVTALSATCEVGEVCSFGTKLYHCSVVNTWTAQT